VTNLCCIAVVALDVNYIRDRMVFLNSENLDVVRTIVSFNSSKGSYCNYLKEIVNCKGTLRMKYEIMKS